MMNMENFDDIRSYSNEELGSYLKNLSQEKQFVKVLSTVYPLMPKEKLIERLTTIKDTYEYQKGLINPFLQYIEANLTRGVEIEGLKEMDNEKAYLYISNHRDIILDSALLCSKLIENNLNTVEIAIGDNLLIFPWIEDLVRVNKSFIVRRGLSAKQVLESSQKLSAYIKYNVREKNQSVWIAQREGRAKDSDDRTQESLLKMFNMSGQNSILQNLADINICPIAISYEYDPCDYLKAKEFQQKRDNPDFKKQATDDLINMKTGVMGFKGKVVYSLAGNIAEDILSLQVDGLHKNQVFEKVAQLIDKHIHSKYSIFKVNKIAYDLLKQSDKFGSEYSLIEKLDFEKYLEKQIEKIDLVNKDVDFLTVKLLEMYANPLINQLNI